MPAMAHPPAPGTETIARRLASLQVPGDVLIVGLTGSVASGKSTLAGHIVDALRATERVAETVSTDGFLFPNTVLAERELTNRKGFPETYDHGSMAGAIRDLRSGGATFPAYSHETFDVDPALARQISKPDVLVLEGLGLPKPTAPPRESGEADVFIYLDADLAHIEAWFLERFMRFWRAAEHDPTSFYAQFRHMSEAETEVFAMQVWRTINLPNLEQHILPLREHADMVVKKDRDHSVRIVEDRLA